MVLTHVELLYYGYSLPTESLVGKDCISCKSPENNQNENNNNQNGNNNNYQYQDYYGDEAVFDVCEELYEEGMCLSYDLCLL